jgi:hypothetical protein
MMVNYKVKNYTAHITNPAALHADVIEVTTGHTIKSNLAVERARELCRHLNFGGGFDGFTPAFFLQNNAKISMGTEELV